MPVLRSERTYPLSFTADALNTDIVAAYDWRGDRDNSNAGGNGQDHSGNARHWTPQGTTPLVVADIGGVTGIDGRDNTQGATVTGSLSNAYVINSGLQSLGLDVGTGDFTLWFRLRAPTATPSTYSGHNYFRLRNGAGTDVLYLGIEGYNVSGKYHPTAQEGASSWVTYAATNPTGAIAPGAVFDVHVKRTSGTLKFFVNAVQRGSDRTSTISWTTGTPGSPAIYVGNQNNTQNSVLIDSIFWDAALSDGQITAHAADPYGYYTNSAPADSIEITSPANAATVGTTVTLSGTYAGSGTPTGIEYRWNGGGWTTLSGATISGGTWSGSVSGLSAATGTMEVRWANSTGVTDSITLTVVAASIAFDAAGTLTSGDASRAVPYKIFQRDSSNQASVRLKGTYTGSPGTIEYRWDGGSWATLVASPSAGTFDQTITLTGPGQGALEVRHSVTTAATASLAAVGVGDVWLVAGQSNNVGMASNYVAPTAPGAHPGWVASKLGKDNVWVANAETSGEPFDDRTSSAYAAYYAQTVYASYFGALATLVMAAGVPVAFVPCAMGSTGISQWQPGQPLNLALLDRASLVGAHRGVIWWQGETDASNGVSESSYRTSLNTIIEAWYAAKSTKWLLVNINDQGITGSGPIRAAIAAETAANSHVRGLADMLAAWSGGVHYDTPTHINTIAGLVYAAMAAAGPTINTQPSNQTATAPAAATFSVAATTSGGALSYQWQRQPAAGGGYSSISGATSASYTTGSTAVSGGSHNNGDTYRCAVTDGNGTTNTTAATLTVNAPPASVSITLTTDGTTPAASLTGLKWAFFDQVTPDLFAAPVAKGAVESTDGSGVLVLDITGSALAPGAVGWLVVTNSDGTTSQSPAHKLFAGPVTVS